ncbi:hypothetical protein MCOR02_011340 [Pyricularia oryzae]|uniref:Levanase n=1 Tax=Pyricularia oryzae TaxID=318829 RepID=A0A4P7NCJ9_PYROR|nr:hypothetical protein MCOR02_011340 [Pyricularia oryzae]KAI6289823.1 hypothetical protein MCOR34_010619 [Pyricularia oryzae]KAI6452769.1 hypothetical protein MCOR17_009398 [Pyricularia oryzae]KAI6480907.1 hypothetical protein MCOR13_011021 [Pyricularia oryzae]KAI6558078.1 hypothetical protein MCOR04_010031 [Pyricularia oryzae]
MKFTFVSSALLALVSSAAAQAPPVPQPLTADWLLNKAGNNSLFTRWRPRSHFIAPSGWMNDPCGAVHDPATDTYHLHYQFHPNHVGWGNVSWGHAVSKDLFHWTDVGGWENDTAVSLAASHYKTSPLSVFTGTTQPVNLQGEHDGTLLTFLTGIHRLPTNWKIHYQNGTEVQALFTSKDAGLTWQEQGIAIPGPPEGWNVTGFRDPSFFPNPDLDAMRNVSEPHYYAVLGSGLKGPDVPAELPGAARPGYIGPRMPLYTAPASNLTDWKFLGALWEPAANSSLGNPDVTGSFGYNFEVSGLFELKANGSDDGAFFVTTGAEGGNTTRHVREQWAVWARGNLSPRANGSIELKPSSGGAVDWGLSYAQASFVDSRKGNQERRVMWGWANEDIEDNVELAVARTMGYAGAITLPTELFLMETRGVQKHDYVDGNEWIPDNGAFTAQTLGIRPLPDVIEKLKTGAALNTFDVATVTAGTPKKVSENVGDSYVLTATLAAPNGTAGIVIAQSPDNSEYTSIVYDAAAKTIGVRRDHSSSLVGIFSNYTHEGHFAPYKTAGGAAEDIKFTIVYDKSLLEVFVNDRFALTSRIYPVRTDSTALSFFTGAFGSDKKTDATETTVWKDVKLWMGLAKAWTERPDDSSSPLHWDSAEQTNNYTWWNGW